MLYVVKGKVSLLRLTKVGFPVLGGDPCPGSSPPQVAFSRAGAIKRLGGRSIRRTCGYLRSFLNTATRLTDESAVVIRGEFLAKGNYATTARQQNRSRTLSGTSQDRCQSATASSVHSTYCM